MSTTSLKLPEDIRARVATAAEEQGITAHAFMVEAIKRATTAAEQRAKLLVEAKTARASALRSGEGFAADEVHAYLRKRIAGKATGKRPAATTWRR